MLWDYTVSMKQIFLPMTCLIASFNLSACGEKLGTFQVQDAHLVRQLPQGDETAPFTNPYPEYLRIEISSRANLNAADTGAGLYVNADFCPFDNRDQIIAFGPLATDEHAVESWLRRDKLKPDHRDGRFHYFVYLVTKSPPRKIFSNSPNEIVGYDLVAQRQDICFRFSVPGYNIIPSQSDIVQVPIELVRNAIASGRATQ